MNGARAVPRHLVCMHIQFSGRLDASLKDADRFGTGVMCQERGRRELISERERQREA
jgi:hypothetical protein